MDNSNKLKTYKSVIINVLSENLKFRQFKRKANTFTMNNNDLVYYIKLQSSQSSTSEILKATINIEISSLILLPVAYDPIHFHKRIGEYLQTPYDKWWVIDSEKSAILAADEISQLLFNKVIPELDMIKTTGDLANLWRQNKCPGLTEFQRKEYLSFLSNQ